MFKTISFSAALNNWGRRSGGGILPLMALLLLPLVAILGLVVDVSIGVGAKNDLQTKINQAALGGISDYLYFQGEGASECGQTPVLTCAAEQALSRTKAVAKLNFTLGEKFTTTELSEPLHDFGTFGQAGLEGKIALGKYHWFKPCDSGADCDPCGGSYPCFQPLEVNNPASNAIQITANFSDTNRIKTFFMRVLGIEEVGVTVKATATLLPSNHVFLLDLSRSTIQDNYPLCGLKRSAPYATCSQDELAHPWLWCFNRDCSESGTRGEFIFRLDKIKLTTDEANTYCTDTPDILENHLRFSLEAKCSPAAQAAGADCPIIDGNDPVALRDSSDFGAGVPSGMAGNRLPAYHQTNNRHFRDEFRCRTVKGALSGESSGEEIVALVDYGRGYFPIPGYPMPKFFQVTRPTPLFDIIDAAHSGMQLLKERAVAADKFGMLAFDDTFCFPDLNEPSDPPPCTFGDEGGTEVDGIIFSSRHLPLTPVDLSTDSNFNKFLDATNLSIDFIADHDNFDRDFISRGLFPLKGFTDIHFAIQRGIFEITNLSGDTFKNGKNSLFIFTDGLANCPYRHSTTSDPSSPWKFTKDGECLNDATTVVKAIESIINPEIDHLVDRLKRNKISVSVALVGGTSGAHTLVRKAPGSDKCLDQVAAALLEEQEGDELLVDTTQEFGDHPLHTLRFPYDTGNPADEENLNTAYFSAIVDSDQPFYAPNALYNGLVKPTRGLWCPLLPPLFINNNVVVFDQELTNACAAASDESPIGELELEQDTTILLTDARGRLLYDPYGRTIGQQLRDCVKLSMQSPYVLAP